MLQRPLYPSRSELFPYDEKTFMYGDTPVMYFDAGAGPAIVLVHGLGANLTHFEHVAPPLVAAGFRVCGLDLPGFGHSGKPRRTYSIRWLAGAVTALMDQLGIERATLAGHSLGGLVVSDAALHEPERVERLVLISSAGLFKMPLPFQWVARTIMRPGLVAAALERNARRLLEKRVFEERNEKVERFIEQSVTRPDPRFVRDLARVMWSLRKDLTGYHLFDEVERLTMPTLVIYGGRDRLLPTKAVPTWAGKLPAGQLEVIERCGHMPIIEKPEQVVARMTAFLSRTAESLPASATAAVGSARSR
ncbi:MAG: alpha/beta hydrolase fold protein [Myxococcales bacterium]|nr:alpha/beta hydrolase fold protein [Myxococcales bacterium]